MLASHTSVGSLEISQRIKAIVILAVNEGRIIFNNTKENYYTYYLLSCFPLFPCNQTLSERIFFLITIFAHNADESDKNFVMRFLCYYLSDLYSGGMMSCM